VSAEPPLVTTVVDSCVPIDRSQLDRLLSIELGTSADTASSSTGPTHVHVRCVPAGIELNLQDALTRKGMVRVLSRDSFRDASSTRLLALAIAEFVVASWVELRLPQKVQPVPVGPPPSPVARQAAETKAAERVRAGAPAQDEDRTQIGVSGQLQAWSEQEGPMLGVGVRFVHVPLSSIAFSIGGDFAADQVEHALGYVVVRTGSVSIAALGRLELPPAAVLTGPGARLGIVQLAGNAYDPMSTDDFASEATYGGLFWLGRGEVYVIDDLALTLDLELGAVTLPVKGLVPERAAIAIDGVWLTVGLGLAIEL